MLTLQEIVKNIDILDSYKTHLPSLEKVSDDQASCACPFHGGDEPKFDVDLTTGRFSCWGCSEHGDIVDFIAKVEGRTYEEVMNDLALKAGLDPEEHGGLEIKDNPGSSVGHLGQNSELAPECIDKETFPVIEFPLSDLPPGFRNAAVEFASVLDVQVGGVAGAMLAIVSGLIGNSFKVAANADWTEPIFIWFLFIADSGYGKTPLLKQLISPIYKMEQEAAADHEERQAYESGDTHRTQIIISDTTVESLAQIFRSNPMGVICHLDEASSLIMGLDQYKGKGNDRPHYLALFNANPWKINRVGRGEIFVPQTGISLLGGIQTRIVPRIFSAESFDDGMIYRFLVDYPDTKPRTFNRKGVSEKTQQYWAALIEKSFGLRPSLMAQDAGRFETKILMFDESGLDLFESFYNDFNKLKPNLSDLAWGFVPKLITYGVRLAGVVHIIQQIEEGADVESPISSKTVETAINLTRYFGGQAIKLLGVYSGNQFLDWQTKRLIAVLNSLKGEVKNGRLPLKKIQEKYNDGIQDQMKIENNKRLGTMLRKVGLTTGQGAGNRSELHWDEAKIRELIHRHCPTN